MSDVRYLLPVDPDYASLDACRARLAWYDAMLALPDVHPSWRERWELDRERECVAITMHATEADCERRGEPPPDNPDWLRAVGRLLQVAARSISVDLDLLPEETRASTLAQADRYEDFGRQLATAHDPVALFRRPDLDR